MLFKIFDWIMIKLGHKYAFVNAFGDVSVHRYFIFFPEKHIATNWKEKYLPNIFVHQFVGKAATEEEGDVGRDVAHTHPWSTISFILKGGYSEEIDYSTIKVNKRFSFCYRDWKSSHRMLVTQPDTWTIFAHGIRRGVWAFDMKVHEKVCNWCQTNNNNVCFNEGKPKIHEFSKHREFRDTSKESLGWRENSWIKCDKDYDKIIADRKRAIARGKITKPNIKWDAVLRKEFRKLPSEK